jgi:hypothetical protein
VCLRLVLGSGTAKSRSVRRLASLCAWLSATALIAGCGASTTTTTTVITGTAAAPVPSIASTAPATTTTGTIDAGPDNESSAGVRPRTLAQQAVAAATRYAGPYLLLRHDQLRGVEYIARDVAHAGWQIVLVTYAARGAGRSDTSGDLLLYLTHGPAGWTVVRAR